MTSDWNMIGYLTASYINIFDSTNLFQRNFGLICQNIDKKPTDYRRVISIFVQMDQSVSKVKVMVVM